MERLKAIKNSLVTCVEGQIGHLDQVDTKELGDAIDMIKDLEEAMYYCSIVKAMEESKQEPQYRDMDRDMGRMYYMDPRRDRTNRAAAGDNWEPHSWTRMDQGYPSQRERELPMQMRDSREGRSPISRRYYMESKEMHKDKTEKMRELENYLKELSEDIMEMIEDASPEERQVLEKKMTQLTTKISQIA